MPGLLVSIALILFSAGLAWALWSKSGRATGDTPTDLRLQETLSVGDDTGAGNLLGVQPFMVPLDYASEERFYAKLAAYLEIAGQKGWLNEKTTVIWPEYLGTWLVTAGEKRTIYQASGISEAMQTLVLSNLFSFVRVLLSAGIRVRASDKIKYSLFRLKARPMAEIYHSVFSRLAREYGVTIVAGSILLPSPSVRGGVLTAGEGELYNVSPVYKPNGSIHDKLVRKAFLTEDEKPFTLAAPVSELPIFETPAGRLAVLICADSWYPSSYRTIRSKKPDLLAVPSYLSPDGVWERPWRGYNSEEPPKDVDLCDVERLTEGEAWLKYAVAGRLRSAGASHGMNVFLRGRIWDLGSDGHTLILQGDELTEAEQIDGAAIVNCWLDSPTTHERR